MISLRAFTKYQRKKVLKASLLKPTNVLVLATGILAGTFSGMLIPVGIVAYGVLCYLDLSSEGFLRQVLRSDECPGSAVFPRPLSTLPLPIDMSRKLETLELRKLQTNILATFQKITWLYEKIDDFTRELWGNILPIQKLVERSNQLLYKAQNIQDYLSSEQVERIQHGVTLLQEKIDRAEDAFSREQYQQALDARKGHLANLCDMQRSYVRLVSQLTNISISLDSLHSRMVKLSTAEHSPAKSESGRVIEQLHGMLYDMEVLDAAINEQLSLSRDTPQTP